MREAVYVTDSFFPQLVVIPLGPDRSLPPPSAATVLPLGGDNVQTEGFNLNGIVAENGVLLVDQSSTGKLFRVDPATGAADEIDLGGANIGYTDGLELRGHALYVVRPFDNRVTKIALGAGLTSRPKPAGQGRPSGGCVSPAALASAPDAGERRDRVLRRDASGLARELAQRARGAVAGEDASALLFAEAEYRNLPSELTSSSFGVRMAFWPFVQPGIGVAGGPGTRHPRSPAS